MASNNIKRRANKIFSKLSLKKSEQEELTALVCELTCEGLEVKEIQELVADKYPDLVEQLNRQEVLTLVRAAAQNDQLTYRPNFENELAQLIAKENGWAYKDIAVVHSRSLNHVAQEAANRLLDQIRDFKKFGGLDTVHIGFAGGRLLRLVAEKLVRLLRMPSRENPSQLVFHAMVAAFNKDDFEADPNSFITYFLQQPLSVEISCVPIAAPGIVETKYRKNLRKFREIDEVYRAAEDLNIIISSGGDWEDEHSTTQRYLKEVDESDVQALNDYPAVGDLLWQPLSNDGPIDMDNGDFTFRPNTLVDLQDLSKAINDRGVRVLLALGPCGKCGKPKGKLLNTIMRLKPKLVTDIVTNSPTVYNALKIAWEDSEPSTKKPK